MSLRYNHIMNIMIDFMTLFLHVTLGHHHVSIIQAGQAKSPHRQPFGGGRMIMGELV